MKRALKILLALLASSIVVFAMSMAPIFFLNEVSKIAKIPPAQKELYLTVVAYPVALFAGIIGAVVFFLVLVALGEDSRRYDCEER